MKTIWLLPILALFPLTALGADPKADFLKLIDRPRVELKAETGEVDVQDDALVGAFSYAARAGERVPGVIVRPRISDPDPAHVKRLPVVILLHGTGGRKEDMLPLAHVLAGKGFLAVAIDGPYHGARTKSGAAGGSSKNQPDYQDAILKAYETGQGHPFFIDTVWDVMRLIDYLDTRTDVDPRRIGIYGVSKGGIEAYLAAAADERIAVAVPCIAMESFQWAEEHDAWQSRIGTVQKAFDAAAKEAGVDKPDGKFVHDFYAKVAPGIDGEFDGPSMGPLIAPRPLLCVNGELDPRASGAGLKLATDAIGAAYQKAGAADHFSVLIEKNTPHRVTAEGQAAGVAWLVRWLKPGE